MTETLNKLTLKNKHTHAAKNKNRSEEFEVLKIFFCRASQADSDGFLMHCCQLEGVREELWAPGEGGGREWMMQCRDSGVRRRGGRGRHEEESQAEEREKLVKLRLTEFFS